MPKSERRVQFEQLLGGGAKGSAAVTRAISDLITFDTYVEAMGRKYRRERIVFLLESLRLRCDRMALMQRIAIEFLSEEERSTADGKVAKEMHEYEQKLLA